MNPYYEDGSVTLYHGDCLDVMREMPSDSIDLVFTSPPYNLGGAANSGMPKKGSLWSGNPALSNGYEDHDDAMPYAEYVRWQGEVLSECWRLLRDTGAIYYQHKPRPQNGRLQTPLDLIPSHIPVRQIVIWDRGNGMNFSPTHYLPMHEWIVVMAKPKFKLTSRGASGAGDVWRVPPVMGSAHPAPFPLSLPAVALETTGAKTVLDPFAGSGTTLRAAADAGARGIGIELTARYCDMAIDRLAQGAFDFEESA